jgi:hypothetical protein
MVNVPTTLVIHLRPTIDLPTGCQQRGNPIMNDRLSMTLVVIGSVLAIAFASTPTADASPDPTRTNPVPGPGGSVAMPPGAPIAVYPKDQNVGGANPYTPYGTNPLAPYGVWTP